MKRIALSLLSLPLAAAPTAANTASLRLTLIVPISCSADAGPGSVSGRTITLSVRRSCNTAHNLVFTGRFNAALGDVTLRYNGESVDMRSDHATIPQPERYYDGVDQVVIEAAGGTQEALSDYAASLRIAVEAA